MLEYAYENHHSCSLDPIRSKEFCSHDWMLIDYIVDSSYFNCLNDDFFYKKEPPRRFSKRRASLREWFVKFTKDDVKRFV